MISVIQNTYERNPFVRESAALTIKALEESKLDYQYIIFNDKGDELIFEDVKDLLNDKVEYIYSEHNFGMGVCSGGWVGALPYVKGDLIHNTGQDDVFTSTFYLELTNELKREDIFLAYANGFVVDNNLSTQGALMSAMGALDYSNPKRVFNQWFQRQGNILGRANNFIPAPGVIYKKELHTLIGEPDLLTFKGSADFEYWARVLYNGLGVSYVPKPIWLYRMSEYSAGSKTTATTEIWNNLILEKYQKLVDNE